MFGTLGGPELFLILVVALIVFGPRKLPEIGKSMGKMMAEFRKASQDFQRTIEDEVEAEKLREATRIDPPSWSSTAPATPAALPASTTDAASASATTDATPAPEPAPASPEVRPDAPPDAPPEATAPAETVSRGTVAVEPK